MLQILWAKISVVPESVWSRNLKVRAGNGHYSNGQKFETAQNFATVWIEKRRSLVRNLTWRAKSFENWFSGRPKGL